MGDRVTFVFHGSADFMTSPGVYIHWGGERAVETIIKHQGILRLGDPSYSAARFVAAVCADQEGWSGIGLYNAPKKPLKQWTPRDIERLSPGDAGILFVNVDTGEVHARGGYLDPGRYDDDDDGPKCRGVRLQIHSKGRYPQATSDQADPVEFPLPSVTHEQAREIWRSS